MARRRRGRPVNGWIVLDKPAGMTSTRAVSAVRRLLQAAKAGHAGTLDPLATGVLPIALGEATKAMAFVVDSGKSYRFSLCWGQERDTDDAEGSVVSESAARPERGAVEQALVPFVGDISQQPPAYSAIKVDGERAYDLARDGRPPALAPRMVRIDALRLVDWQPPDGAGFEMRCGKGAYVRAIARDLGRALGCFAHVTALRRTRVGPFDEGSAISLDKLQSFGHKEPPEGALLPVETALADIPALAVTGSEASRLKCGQAVRVPSSMEGTIYATADGRPVALAQISGGEVRPVRVFNL